MTNTRASAAKPASTAPVCRRTQPPQDSQGSAVPLGRTSAGQRIRAIIGGSNSMVTPQAESDPKPTASPKPAINGMPVRDNPANTSAVVKLVMPQGPAFSRNTSRAAARGACPSPIFFR